MRAMRMLDLRSERNQLHPRILLANNSAFQTGVLAIGRTLAKLITDAMSGRT